MADFDISQLQGLLSQFGPSEEEKRQAKMAAIAQFGLGLLGAPKGGEFQRVGLSGINAMNTQQEQLANLRNQKMQGMAAAQQAMGLQEMMRRQQQDAEARQTAADYYKGAQQPGAGLPMMGGQPPMGGQPAPMGGPIGPANDKRAKFEQYMGLSQALAAKGLMDPAEKAAAMAEKFRPKLKDTKTLTQNGQRVTVNFYDDGTTDVVPYGPDQEKAHFLDTGGQVGAVDPFTGKPIAGGGLYNKTVSPDAALSSDTTRRGQNMVDARSREAQALAQQQASAGQIVPTPDGLFVVDKKTGSGRAVMGPDGKPLSQAQKPLSESQAKATVFANQMISASNRLAELEKKGFTGTGFIQQSDLAGAGAEGIPYVPGSAAIPRLVASTTAHEYTQNAKQWVEGFLRFQSGATITPEELSQGFKTYFPQRNDPPALVQQKKQARLQAEENMRAAAGQAGTAQFRERAQAAQPSGGISRDAIEAEMKRRGLN
jgi:hypothetical protein